MSLSMCRLPQNAAGEHDMSDEARAEIDQRIKLLGTEPLLELFEEFSYLCDEEDIDLDEPLDITDAAAKMLRDAAKLIYFAEDEDGGEPAGVVYVKIEGRWYAVTGGWSSGDGPSEEYSPIWMLDQSGLADDLVGPSVPEPPSDTEVVDTLNLWLSAREWPGASGMEDVCALVRSTGRTEIPDAPEWRAH